MSTQKKTLPSIYEALRQVRKEMPRPVRIKESKKRYLRAREREKVATELRTF